MTLNEIEGIQNTLHKIDMSVIDQLIIVDGGSVDGTVEWADERGYTVYHQKKKGIRHGYFEVLPMIEGDIVVLYSPDGNCIEEVIPDLINKVKEGYDMVIASRYKDDATSEDDDIITSFGNWLFTKTVNVLHGGNYTDAMVIYRAFRKEIIEKLDLTDERAYRFYEILFFTCISWEPLMSVRAAKAKLRVTEIAASEPKRIGGKRKLQIFRWGGAFYLQFLAEVFYWKKR